MKTLSRRNPTKSIAIVGIGLLALVFATTSPAPIKPTVSPKVVIDSATADLTTLVMTITGANFGAAPSVILGNNALTVNTFSATSIVATIPNSVGPGSYLLSVTNPANNSTALFYVTTITGGTGGGGGGVPHGMKEFTASDTWVVPSGVTRLHVEVWGAGGGTNDCECGLGGGWGGAGAYSRTAIFVTEGDNITITVGQGGGPGQAGTASSVADTNSNYVITSGGGGGGGDGTCSTAGADGSPGTPDPNAQIGRSSAFQRFGTACCPPTDIRMDPAPGTIQPLGGFGGVPTSCPRPPTSGSDGYVFIQW